MEEILAEAAGEVRRIEKLADQLLGVVRHLEDCQDPDELREAASTIEACPVGDAADDLGVQPAAFPAE